MQYWPQFFPELQGEVAARLDPGTRQCLAMTNRKYYSQWYDERIIHIEIKRLAPLFADKERGPTVAAFLRDGHWCYTWQLLKTYPVIGEEELVAETYIIGWTAFMVLEFIPLVHVLSKERELDAILALLDEFHYTSRDYLASEKEHPRHRVLLHTLAHYGRHADYKATSLFTGYHFWFFEAAARNGQVDFLLSFPFEIYHNRDNQPHDAMHVILSLMQAKVPVDWTRLLENHQWKETWDGRIIDIIWSDKIIAVYWEDYPEAACIQLPLLWPHLSAVRQYNVQLVVPDWKSICHVE